MNRRTYSSRSHSLKVIRLRLHSTTKTSERVAAKPGVICTPERSTERGLAVDARCSFDRSDFGNVDEVSKLKDRMRTLSDIHQLLK